MSDQPFPEVVSGFGSVEAIPDLVADGLWNSVLLVCGKHSFEASGASRITSQLEAVADVERWSDFQPNAAASDLLEGLRLVDETDPDVVIGIGGGSAMDLAKLLCGFDGVTAGGELESAITSGQQLDARHRGLILVPTTSGSGSEATHFSTVYIGDDKYSAVGQGLRPDAVVLDPELTMSASAYQKATSGIDAVAQAIESMWAVTATNASRRFARRALRYLLPNIEEFVHDPSGETAAAMITGAHLAGRAIDTSRTTAAHALSYAITQGYGIPHGHAVALTLGRLLEAHAEAAPASLQADVDPDQHARVMTEILDRLGATNGAEARHAFLGLMKRLDLTTSLAEVGVATHDQRAGIAASVNPERLGNNPVSFDETELLALLE
jgi:alcohol dehydrogenase